MAAKKSNPKSRQNRNQAGRAATPIADAATRTTSTADAGDAPFPELPESLVEAIDAERAQLLEAYALVKCLNEVLLYADDEDSLQHADVAKVAANLIDESVTRLDSVTLRSVVKEGKQEEVEDDDNSYDIPEDRLPGGGEVRDGDGPTYLFLR